MSTYYHFHCDRCEVSGGCFTRQAWGWGNADLIDTFKFVMWHVKECGEQHIGMHSEHNDDKWPNTNFEDEHRAKHLTQTADIFPHSNDWQFMTKAAGADPNLQWTQQELNQLEDTE